MVSKRSVSAQFSTQPLDYQNYIDGAFISKTENYIEVLNPATGDLLGRIPESNESDVNSAVKAARKAQTAWEKLPLFSAPDTCAKSQQNYANIELSSRISSSKSKGKLLALLR